ncbi:MAG TPA: hypothetical protein VHC22_12960 [Pirellulales bacterium]|nr:hypothetical protein [Pirellulales bacterium]
MKYGLFVGVCTALLVLGCQKRLDRPDGVFRSDEGEYVLTIVLDLSGSFNALMAEDGKAWAFVCQVIEQYFQDRLGHSDKLILAQLSANDRALLWRGTPLELRQDFSSASAFREWLMSKADPYGSLVYEGIVKATEYTLADPILADGKGKAALFILSDMCDTAGEVMQSRDRAVKAIADLVRHDGVVGIYYVDVGLCPIWQQLLHDAGVPATRSHVEAEIVGRPLLPSFE